MSRELPRVTVIVPVRNRRESIGCLIQSLKVQDYPQDLVEIFIVDNGSHDGTVSVISADPRVNFLKEKEIGPSAARNRGVRSSDGEIIAFTDSDCVPETGWIRAGVMSLVSGEYDMVGGRISFTLHEDSSASQYLDSLINLNNEYTIRAYGSAVTANLFVRKSAFKKVGLFNKQLLSGEDFEWTGRAKQMGLSMGYCAQAVVTHPARGFRSLLLKHFRVGTGSISVWKGQKRSCLWMIARWCSLFLPILSFQMPLLIRRRGISGVRYPVLRMMVIAYMCKIASALGVARSFFR